LVLSKKKSSVQKFRLKRILETFRSKEGRHTELVSLYIPYDRQISDVISNLKQEYGTAANIKTRSTRKNVLDAIERVIQRLKLFKKIPSNGLAIFCGTIAQNSDRNEKIEVYVIEPPDSISMYYYRCDQKFHLEHLEEMLKEKDIYGIFVIDGNEATIATLKGRNLQIVKEVTSGLPGKHRAGGQSARRFERLREVEYNEYFKRVANHVNKIFLSFSELKGIIIGGAGPTKEEFERRNHLHYTLRDKILAIVDTSYAGKQGIKEVVEKSPDIFKEIRYYEEKKFVQNFLYELGHETGLATYGESEIRKALHKGIIKTLLMSEDFNMTKLSISCSNCSYSQSQLIKGSDIQTIEQTIDKPCPNCSSLNLEIKEKKDVVDELLELSEKNAVDVEIISPQTEEGISLRDAFGGLAAILKFKA